MKSRILKRRLIKARIVLNQTIQKILDISRRKKTLHFVEKTADKEQVIGDELWLLNKLAKQQAQLVKHYETVLIQENTEKTLSR